MNDLIFKYVGSNLPYDGKFWKKFTYRNDIFEDGNENEGFLILDESMIMEEETTIIRPSRKEEEEKNIIYNIEKGWEEG